VVSSHGRALPPALCSSLGRLGPYQVSGWGHAPPTTPFSHPLVCACTHSAVLHEVMHAPCNMYCMVIARSHCYLVYHIFLTTQQSVFCAVAALLPML
jgi:hypothetical protein